MDIIFIKSLLVDKVKIKPNQLTKKYKENILKLIKSKLENKCSKHGFIKKNSIEIEKISTGRIEPQTFTGYTIFDVKFHALICNPSIGSIITGKVKRRNKFGILVIIEDENKNEIIEVIIPKNTIGTSDNINIDFNKINIEDNIKLEILGKKFEINDTKISAIGKIITHNQDDKISIDKDIESFGGSQIEEDLEDDIEDEIEKELENDEEDKDIDEDEKEEDVENEDEDELEDLELEDEDIEDLDDDVEALSDE